MWLGFVAVFLTGALAVKTTGWTATDIVPMVVAGLLSVEHMVNGNTTPTAQYNKLP